MLRCLPISVLLVLWLATDAVAGAWLRETGTFFLSVSGQVSERDDFGVNRQFYSLYGEYGLAERLTVGVDLGHDTVRMSKAIAFARVPLISQERETKLAFELGAGQVDGDNAMRPGLSIGRGIKLWERYGWLNADGRVVLATDGERTLESDLTAGLSVTDRSMIILQLQLGRPDEGSNYAQLAPSYVFEVKPGRHIQFEFLEPLKGGSERGLSLGLWLAF